jgi:hypothetical protein
MTLVGRVLPVSRFLDHNLRQLQSTGGSERTVVVAEQQAAQYTAKGDRSQNESEG